MGVRADKALECFDVEAAPLVTLVPCAGGIARVVARGRGVAELGAEAQEVARDFTIDRARGLDAGWLQLPPGETWKGNIEFRWHEHV